MTPAFMLDNNDCMRAAIASLLDLDTEAIPHFLDGLHNYSLSCLKDDDLVAEIFHERVERFLRPRNLTLLEFSITSHDDLASWRINLRGRNIYHLLSGVTEAYPDILHACVAKDGYIVHDPKRGHVGIDAHTFPQYISFLVARCGAAQEGGA